jgi:hypothetical protein
MAYVCNYLESDLSDLVILIVGLAPILRSGDIMQSDRLDPRAPLCSIQHSRRPDNHPRYRSQENGYSVEYVNRPFGRSEVPIVPLRILCNSENTSDLDVSFG